jgi:hypothetical protein
MSKTTYWITTTEGTHGRVTGVEERDRWTPLGYQVVDEPSPTDFVWMRKDGLDAPARFPYGAAPTWEAMGWEYSAPPEPVDVTKDSQLFDQPKAPAPAVSTSTTSKPATGADKNTKE